jgi:2-isopropylmalate synthase
VRFKEVAERKKGGLDDDDLEALVADEVYSAQAMWRLERVQVTTGSGVVPTATVALTGPDGVERQGVAMGTGPVDAAYKAIDALTSVKVHLETYSMESVNAGIEAMATTKVVVNPVDSATSLHSSGYTTSRKFSGSGSDTDVVVSSARAYVAAVNKLIRWNMRRAAAEQVEAQEA